MKLHNLFTFLTFLGLAYSVMAAPISNITVEDVVPHALNTNETLIFASAVFSTETSIFAPAVLSTESPIPNGNHSHLKLYEKLQSLATLSTGTPISSPSSTLSSAEIEWNEPDEISPRRFILGHIYAFREIRRSVISNATLNDLMNVEAKTYANVVFKKFHDLKLKLLMWQGSFNNTVELRERELQKQVAQTMKRFGALSEEAKESLQAYFPKFVAIFHHVDEAEEHREHFLTELALVLMEGVPAVED